jgi:hypothetical protein
MQPYLTNDPRFFMFLQVPDPYYVEYLPSSFVAAGAPRDATARFKFDTVVFIGICVCHIYRILEKRLASECILGPASKNRPPSDSDRGM